MKEETQRSCLLESQHEESAILVADRILKDSEGNAEEAMSRAAIVLVEFRGPDGVNHTDDYKRAVLNRIQNPETRKTRIQK